MTSWITGVPNAAKEFGVSEKTIRRWITDGVLRAERIGPRLIRIDIDSLRTTPLGPSGGENS